MRIKAISYKYYRTHVKIEKGQDPFLEEFKEVYIKWAKMENRQSPEVAQENLISPLRDISIKYILDNRAPLLLRYCMECLYTYDNLKHLHEFIRRSLIGEAWSIRKCKNSLIELLAEYKKKKS